MVAVLSPPRGYLAAMMGRFAARLAGERGEAADDAYAEALTGLRDFGALFPLAATLVEQAEWLVASGRTDDAASPLTEAREIFERLRAVPWLERIERLEASRL
jgi:hypothetical protein